MPGFEDQVDPRRYGYPITVRAQATLELEEVVDGAFRRDYHMKIGPERVGNCGQVLEL